MDFTRRQSLFLLFLLLLQFPALSQAPKGNRKYPSLLWEIRGKNLKKPSYLIGTMHVSSKLAFNLPDSFFLAIRKADVVALETNPETWQADMNKYDLGDEGRDGSQFDSYFDPPSEFLNIRTLKFYKYDKKIERSLYSNPSTINNLLYRSYGNESSDFEEDTYLDMYIYQCGKKWGKKVAGVEDYGQSLRLMAEGNRDAAREKDKKERSYNDYDERYSSDRLQEAYRKGDLDLLDSINRYNSESAAFDEKFIYRRNEIQSDAIDSILRSGSTLFVGVGAAHLPGDRGVIELLRKKGYTLRPVKMGERASREKDALEKIRVPVTFHTESIQDGAIRVDVPGTLFKLNEDASLEQWQYADMANGSYYMITRLMTNAWCWNHSPDQVHRVVDSLLYENIPGKIISKNAVTRNGYRGFDIVNRTRRGDYQRYQIYVTPFEVLFFKMSGTGDYIRQGTEASRFFGSIQLREYRHPGEGGNGGWVKYSPGWGGFTVDLPHEPYIGNDGSWIFDATDKATGNYYRIIRSDVHNYHFAEEDSFDLTLMQESFLASEYIDSLESRKYLTWKGYPALDAQFRHKDGKVFLCRFIIKGPHYYTLAALGDKENPAMRQFLNSFDWRPYEYGSPRNWSDTSLYYSLRSPWFPVDKKIRIDIDGGSNADDDEEEDIVDAASALENGLFRGRALANDSTGEKVYVSFLRPYRYFTMKDSVELDRQSERFFTEDSTWIIRKRKYSIRPDGFRVWDVEASDTGSSRMVMARVYYRNGIGYTLMAQGDTLSRPGAFVQAVFDSFSPADTLRGLDPAGKGSALFFEDLFSADSLRHKRAVKHIGDVRLDSTDLPQVKKAIARVNWTEKKYLDTKVALIGKLGNIKTRESAQYLKDLFYAAQDTVQLQYAALENLLQHRNAFAYGLFRDIIRTDPPVIDPDYFRYSFTRYFNPGGQDFDYDNGNFLDELEDSLALTRTILPELLPLLNLDDYESRIMGLLGKMADSNLLKPSDYEAYYTKFYFEARQELKKQAIAEKKKAIEKAEEERAGKKEISLIDIARDPGEGNEDLSLYASLLIPFQQAHPEVKNLLQQILRSDDKRLRYNTFLQLLDHGQSWPDSLVGSFARMDEYRYELYQDLRSRKKLNLFPAAENSPVALARSALIFDAEDDAPDSLVYIDRLPARFRNNDGYVYFFRYKEKKDDLNWKLATSGMFPADTTRFTFADQFDTDDPVEWRDAENRYYFTGLRELKLKEDVPVEKQLRRILQRLLFARRKSGENFYGQDGGLSDDSDD